MNKLSDIEFNQIKVYLSYEWLERLQYDGMFSEMQDDHWIINITNATEFIEALGLEKVVSEDEMLGLVEKHFTTQDHNGLKGINFKSVVEPLTRLLFIEKNVSVDTLIDTNFNLPVDRIFKFLKMLDRELDEKERSG